MNPTMHWSGFFLSVSVVMAVQLVVIAWRLHVIERTLKARLPGAQSA